jgi:putative peptidoglycan lipid II flippase
MRRVSTLRAVSSISAFTLLSRVLGLARDMLMFRALGASWAMGTFVLAWTVPNMLRRLLGEGALSASFLPAFTTSLERNGAPAARSLLASVAGQLVRWLAFLTLAVWIACWLVPAVWLGREDGGVSAAESGGLLLTLIAILFPYVLLICLAAIYTGALNALGVFGWPAALPVVLNVFWIGGLFAAQALFPGDATAVTIALAFCLVGGGVVQLALACGLLRRRGFLPWPRLPVAGDPAHAVFRNTVPTLIGMSIVQVNVLVDQSIAYYLIDPGANSHIYLANRLLLFPHALTGLALATVAFPRFALLASREDLASLRDYMRRAQDATLLLSVPASVGLMLVAGDFIEVFFAHGRFTSGDAAVAADTTFFLVAGLPFIGGAQLYTRALYALGDLTTPVRIGAALLPVNIALNLLFVLGLDRGVPGLTLATSICAALGMLAQGLRLHALCPGRTVGLGSLARVLAATAAMALVVVAVRTLFEPGSRLQIGALRLALPIGLGCGIYLAVLALLGSPELRRLRKRG